MKITVSLSFTRIKFFLTRAAFQLSQMGPQRYVHVPCIEQSISEHVQYQSTGKGKEYSSHPLELSI